ncbi:MAG: hypothetical protein LBV69_02175 [Bacteroidales bacterium]|jgi:hypothetical protein|nr:hypothetical protein [Bacteroidales bacterium]
MSVDKVLNIAKTITTLKIKLPISNENMTKTMVITPKHKSIAILFDDFFLEITLGCPSGEVRKKLLKILFIFITINNILNAQLINA